MTKRTQNWEIGEVVQVGFVRDLEVIKRVETPRDGFPDFYVLWQAAKNRFYTFQPHYGLTRRMSLDDALLGCWKPL